MSYREVVLLSLLAAAVFVGCGLSLAASIT